MKLRNVVLSSGMLAGLILGLGTFLEACVQAGTPTEEKGKAKSRKIWTNDDLQYLRHAWDVYADEKAAAEEAARATEQAAKEAKSIPESAGDSISPKPPDTPATGASVPKTIEEAEFRIREKQEEIHYQQELIDRTEHDHLFSTRDRERASLKKNLDLLNTDLETAQTELKALQDKLKELKAKVPIQPAQPAGVGTRL